MIYAALLHDIGMAANEEEIEDIKEDKLNYHGRKYSVIYKKYQDENLALQECIRPAHGERAFCHIMQMKRDFFVIPEFTSCNFQEELAKICQAHTMDREWLLRNLDRKQVKGEDTLNAQYVAMLLRVADYLDFDEKRAPIELYRLLAPTGFGDEEWRQHYIIGNTEKVKRDAASGNGMIEIYGECCDSKLHRKFLRYLSGLSEEILWCTSYARNHYEGNYRILLQSQNQNRIQTKGFEISDLKLQMDYHAIIKLLMGENVYGDKRCGLRELLQNAIDACRVMAEEAVQLEKYRYVPYVPKIQVILDYKIGKMIVMDNGIGMEYGILTKYFLNIGKSYYKSDEFLYQGKNHCPIGTFGIGFLACFMLSDSVSVETKHFKGQEGFTIELEKDSEYVCKKNPSGFIGESGTAVVLDLESVLGVFGREMRNIKEYIENTFLNQGVHIELITVEHIRETEPVNLKELEELNPEGIKLDSYLDGISAYWKIQFDRIKVSRRFSELCTYGFVQECEFAEYDVDSNKLNMKNLEGEELKKYIEDGYMMALKVQGVRKEEEALYKEWKKWDTGIDIPPHDMVRTIYFPIRYDASLLKYRQKGGFYYGGSGAGWHTVSVQFETEQDALHNWENLKRFFSDCGMLMENVEIELGIFPIIAVGNDRYMEYGDSSQGHFPVSEENETFWHGILLARGRTLPDTRIIGIHCGKCVINILRNDILPNVARDNLAKDEKEKITSAVERAALQYIVSKIEDDKELQKALLDYIDRNYSEENPYYAK